jgi:UDP-glucose:tetrahydrobiopterin glucosyltransferase
MRVMICSTPVGPLGSGVGGGVELTLHSLVLGLAELGHDVEVVAPAGSLLVGTVVHQVPGALQASSQLTGRDAPISMPADPVVAAMWDLVRDHQHRVDLVLNLAYDWLPFHLTPYLHVPVAHLVSMASLSDAMDLAVDRAVAARPGSVAMHSRAQAATFGDPDRFVVVGSGIAVERYDLREAADVPPVLAAVGRISPEKGLDAVAEVSERTGMAVHVFGLLQNPDYWAAVRARHPGANLVHRGFLPTDELQAAIGGCQALLMTPSWVEAFGNVAIEAMACGVPVIAYRRGGPAEIVVDGVTGVLVAPDDVDGLVAAVGRVGGLDRRACRALVDREYSVEAFARRVAAWLDGVAAAAVPVAEH